MRDRVSLRVAAAIAVTCALLLVTGIVAAWYVHRLEKTTSDLLADDVQGIRAAEELVIGIRDLRYQLNRFLASGDRKSLDDVRLIYASTKSWLIEAEQRPANDRERELLAQVRAGYEQFMVEFERVSPTNSAAANR